MDIAEVTLRLDGGLAERLRRDPAERARYEAFLELAAAARTSAQVEQAARLFTAPPTERQRLLTEILDRTFGSEPDLALCGGDAAWATAVWRARSADAPQAAVEPPSVRDEGRAAAVVQALGIPLVPLGVSALLLLMLGGGAVALWYSAIPQGPAFAGAAAECHAGRLPGSQKPLGPGVVAPDHATAGREGNPASRPVPSALHISPSVVRPGAPPPPSAPAAGPAEPAGPSLADALEPSAASEALWTGMEAPPDPPEATAPSLAAAVGSPAETAGGSEPPRAGAEGVSGGLDAAGRAPPGPGRGDSASSPAAVARRVAPPTAVVVHHRAGSPAAERAARLVVEEVRGAGLGGAAVRAVPAVPARRVIRFGRGEDGAAERLALRLRRRWPHPWRLEAAVSPGPARPAPPLEVWLPHR